MRLGPEIQALLRCGLTGHWQRRDAEFGWPGIASGEQFVIERCKNGAMRRQRIAGRHRGVGEENR